MPEPNRPYFEVWDNGSGWTWSLLLREQGRTFAVSPAHSRLTREEAELEVTEVAKAAQVAAGSWLAKHTEETSK